MSMIRPPMSRASESETDRPPVASPPSKAGSAEEKSGWKSVSLGPTGVQSTLIAGALKKRIIKSAKIVKLSSLCMIFCRKTACQDTPKILGRKTCILQSKSRTIVRVY